MEQRIRGRTLLLGIFLVISAIHVLIQAITGQPEMFLSDITKSAIYSLGIFISFNAGWNECEMFFNDKDKEQNKEFWE